MKRWRQLETLYLVTLYVIVVLPFAMILTGSGVSAMMAAIFMLFLIASWFANRRGLNQAPRTRLWNTVILSVIAFSIGDLFVFETSVLDAGIRLVLVLILIKLFSRAGDRDDLQIYALSFLLLAASTTVNEDLTFGILFGLYVLTGTFSLAIFHLRSELRGRPRMLLRGELPLNRQYMGVLTMMSAAILLASIGIFFAFPRIGLGFFVQQSRDAMSVTGFNESVELGGHGVIRDNPEVVMRVEFLDGRPPETSGLHWRTMTFDHYDGHRWSRTLRRNERYSRRTRSGWSFSHVHPSTGPDKRLRIYLEPLGTNLLPVLWPTETLQLGTGKAFRWDRRAGVITFDQYGDIRHTIEDELGVQYVLTTGTPPELDGAPGGEPEVAHDSVDSAYLQLPELSERVRELARSVTQGAGTNQERAEKIEAYLEANYAYTTDLPRVGKSPVESFLFDTRRGHCEYFATAMVMLLRSDGVPARLVNGFLGGKWNDVGGYLAVRQGDAHSWVEYHVPSLGWVPIDPTPATALSGPNPVWQALNDYYDAMRLTWMKWVIEYDLAAQIEVFRKAASALRPRGLMNQRATADESSEQEPEDDDNRRWLMLGGLLVLCLGAYRATARRLERGSPRARLIVATAFWLAAGATWFGWFRGFEIRNLLIGGLIVGIAVTAAFVFRRAPRSATRVTTLFERIERAAARRGTRREPDEGPAGYLERLAAASPSARAPIERFRRLYLLERFGGRRLGPTEQRELRRLVSNIIARLR